MALITRAILTAAVERRTQTVAVPEWGGDVRLRELTAAEYAAYADAVAGLPDTNAAHLERMTRLLVACAIDEGGAPLFTEADLPALAARELDVLKRCFAAAAEVNRLGERAPEAARGNS